MRKTILEKRKALSEEIKKISDQRLCQKLGELLSSRYGEIQNILCYYPLKDEINLLPLYEKLLKNGKVLYFPKTSGSEMDFYKVDSLEEFEEGNFHVMEPALHNKEQLYTGDEAVGIIPGAVFDRELNRMGYGKGYYDRYLSLHPQIVKIAACYDFQIVDKIDAKSWDVKMNYLVTN